MTTPDASDRVTALRRNLGPTGIWSTVPESFGVDGRDLAAAVEKHGFGSLWLGGSHMAPDAFTQLVTLLDGTTKLIVGTGIASIWGREPSDMRQGADTLSTGFPGRFILGLGVGHAPAVENLGRSYDRPYSAMERYLDEMDHPSGRSAERLPPEPRPPASGRSGSWPPSARGCSSCPGTRPTGPTRTSARSSTPRSRARSSARTSC